MRRVSVYLSNGMQLSVLMEEDQVDGVTRWYGEDSDDRSPDDVIDFDGAVPDQADADDFVTGKIKMQRRHIIMLIISEA